jgi:hypothetical protein
MYDGMAGQAIGGISKQAMQNAPNVISERQPLVLEALTTHDAVLQDLDSIINRLEQRLAPALRPVGPSNQQQGKDPEHAVQLVAAMSRATRTLQGQVGRLHEILDRLEI